MCGEAGERPAAGYVGCMRRLVALACVAAATVVLIPLPGQAASRAPRSVLHYGDSLAVGTGIYLPSFLPGWSIAQSTGVSRHADDGPSAVRSLRSSLPRVIVISLGTNDDPRAVTAFARDVREIVRLAGPSRCVIWSSVVRPPYDGVSYAGYNDVLRRAAVRYASLRVFDWGTMAHRHPEWFGSDGVHPTATGYRVRAAAEAKLVKSC
jgi:hypothetical protein